MNYRQREAMRFDQLLWVTTIPGRARIGFESNKYIPPRKSRDFAHVLALELPRLSM
jgi:hypothetical protein